LPLGAANELEQDKNGVWFVVLPDGHRLEFDSNAAAWRWIDRHERREGSAVTGNGVNRPSMRRQQNQPDDEQEGANGKTRLETCSASWATESEYQKRV
jgi:hypothetical protein